MKRFLSVAKWFVAIFDDRLRGLSLTRLLAISCFVFVAHSVFWRKEELTYVHLWILMLGICTAYGKKVLLAFLQRVGLSSVSADITKVTRTAIAKRRTDGAHWDAEAS